MSDMVHIVTSIDATELWSRVWGSEPQSFGSWWRELTYLSGDWDAVGKVRVGLENPEDEEETITVVVTINDIVLALNDPKFPSHLRQHIMDDNADCIDSDAVIQFAVYGEIVFG